MSKRITTTTIAGQSPMKEGFSLFFIRHHFSQVRSLITADFATATKQPADA
jgi:hypothetical protein